MDRMGNHHLNNLCRIEENKGECWDMGILMVVDHMDHMGDNHRLERIRIWSAWKIWNENKGNKNKCDCRVNILMHILILIRYILMLVLLYINNHHMSCRTRTNNIRIRIRIHSRLMLVIIMVLRKVALRNCGRCSRNSQIGRLSRILRSVWGRLYSRIRRSLIISMLESGLGSMVVMQVTTELPRRRVQKWRQ